MPRSITVVTVPQEIPGYGLVTVTNTNLVLADEYFESISGAAITNGWIVDHGPVGSGNLTQAAVVSLPAALTSSQNATTNAVTPANVAYTQADQTTIANLANALKVSYNALQADVAALRATLNAEMTALQAGSTGPQANH